MTNWTKRWSTWMAGLAVAAFLGTGAAVAQQAAAPGDQAPPGAQRQDAAKRWDRHARGPRGEFGRGYARGFGLGVAARELDLTDAQRTQVHEIVQRHRDEIHAAAEKSHQAHRALDAAVAAETVDEGAIRTAATALGEAQAEMALLRARVRTEVRDILTPEQREKAAALEQQRLRRMEERRQQGPARGPRGPRRNLQQ